MTNRNQEESGQFHSEFEEEFAESFVEILDDLRQQAIFPVVRIFAEQIEAHGFSLKDVFYAFSDLVKSRNPQVSEYLNKAAEEVGKSPESTNLEE